MKKEEYTVPCDKCHQLNGPLTIVRLPEGGLAMYCKTCYKPKESFCSFPDEINMCN